jgi:hypothetical protein
MQDEQRSAGLPVVQDHPGYAEDLKTKPASFSSFGKFDGTASSPHHGRTNKSARADNRHHPYARPQAPKVQSATVKNAEATTLKNTTFKDTTVQNAEAPESKSLCPSFTLTGI